MRTLIILVFLAFCGFVVGAKMFLSEWVASMLFPIIMSFCFITQMQVILFFSDESIEHIIRGFKLIMYCSCITLGYGLMSLIIHISKQG